MQATTRFQNSYFLKVTFCVVPYWCKNLDVVLEMQQQQMEQVNLLCRIQIVFEIGLQSSDF